MRCLGCKAWQDGKCKAGVVPYQSKNFRDGVGCACNRKTVEKLMRERMETNADRYFRKADDEMIALFIYKDPIRMYIKTPNELVEWLKSPAEDLALFDERNPFGKQ